jgi:hypothetical protein
MKETTGFQLTKSVLQKHGILKNQSSCLSISGPQSARSRLRGNSGNLFRRKICLEEISAKAIFSGLFLDRHNLMIHWRTSISGKVMAHSVIPYTIFSKRRLLEDAEWRCMEDSGSPVKRGVNSSKKSGLFSFVDHFPDPKARDH